MSLKERSFYIVNMNSADHVSLLHAGISATKALQFDLDDEFELWQHETGRSMTARMIHIDHELYTFSTVSDKEKAKSIVGAWHPKDNMQFVIGAETVKNSDERKEDRERRMKELKRLREGNDDKRKNKKKPTRPNLRKKKVVGVNKTKLINYLKDLDSDYGNSKKKLYFTSISEKIDTDFSPDITTSPFKALLGVAQMYSFKQINEHYDNGDNDAWNLVCLMLLDLRADEYHEGDEERDY